MSRIVMAFMVIASIFWLYRSTEYVSNLDPSPDATEYAATAQRLVAVGKYDIVINGRSLPSRYPPWFPALILAPVYLFVSGNLGAPIFAILACALVCILLTYLLARRLGGETGGIIASLLLLTSQPFYESSRALMSDVPTLMCCLIAVWFYLRLQREERTRDCLYAGLACGAGFAFRYLFATLLIPFIVTELRKRPIKWPFPALVCLPSLIFGLLTLVYNKITFGAFSRTGYQFWCAVPYDYFNLTFAFKFLTGNLKVFTTPGSLVLLIAGVAGLLLLHRMRRQESASILFFFIFSVLPISLIHLFYFDPDLRFHLYLFGALAIVGGGGIGFVLEKHVSFIKRPVFMLIVPAVLIVLSVARGYGEEPGRYLIASLFAQTLPSNCVIITSIDPVYLELTLRRGTEREVLPLDRRVEYASKLIMRKRADKITPPPRSSVDHRAVGLKLAGGKEAVAHTAQDLDYVAALVRSGRPVYLNTVFPSYSKPTVDRLAARFRFEPTEIRFLVRLEPL